MNFIRKIISSRQDNDGNFFVKIKKVLGFTPKNTDYYREAFTHRSLNKRGEKGQLLNYERLEFLGDAILGAVISSYLYAKAPRRNEGYLTKMRSKIVSRKHLNELGNDLNLMQFVDRKIPENNLGRDAAGNIFEALVGAIYLDKGYRFCEKFIHKKLITPYVDIKKLENKITSYKALLVEWCQKQKKEFKFEASNDKGNKTANCFSINLFIEKQFVANGSAISKKKAEEKAAKKAYFILQRSISR